ncbi:MAG: heavy metal translocating P-type ATPase [Bacteroidia bacterium]
MSQTAIKHIELNVKGMTCTNCALGIERYLKKEGLEGVNVDFGNEEVTFDLVLPEKLPTFIKGIEKLGFEVVKDDAAPSGMSTIEKYFYFSLPFTLLLILHMFLPHGFLHEPWVQFGLALPVYLLGMYHFGRSAWYSLRSGVPNMDVLIAIGITAAFGYSLYGTLTHAGPDFLFYETAASIVSLVLLGNLLEHKSVQRTTSAIKDLSQLQPSLATRLVHDPDGERLEKVASKEILIGDQLIVNEGDQIAVDGLLLEGEVEVDESMISGESLPVAKRVGDKLIGGTLLVAGNLSMKATAIGKGTTLSRIIDLVKKAQADKPEIQQLADKISAIFVPAVLIVSALTFMLSYFAFDVSLQASIIHSVAVLVIACPCAMGLATPTAVIVGIGRASKQGILIKGGRTLEAFGKIERMVFDKTGTLTTGAFSIADFYSEAGLAERSKSIILAMEQRSSHPIARSLTRELQDHAPAKLLDITELKGKGLEAKDAAGNLFQLGSYHWLGTDQIESGHDMYLFENGELLAWLDIEDEIRPEASALIAFLKTEGIESVLLSGDRDAKCQTLAAKLGIDEVYSEQLPDQKLALIETFAAEKSTAMIGDGINDAPALARANVGISLGNATEVAIQSAEVILLNENLALIPELFKISKHTVLTIKQNLFWAFFYNVLAIPMAAFGLLTPIIGAATMALSDVVVIGNSLRLKRKSIA